MDYRLTEEKIKMLRKEYEKKIEDFHSPLRRHPNEVDPGRFTGYIADAAVAKYQKHLTDIKLEQVREEVGQCRQQCWDAVSYVGAGKQEGRQEVVDWIEKYRSETTREFMGFTITRAEWQEKLIEWKINT